MYKFVKIQRKGSNDGHWYFKPESEEQVVEHFNKIFGSEIRDGVHDHFEHSHLIPDKSEPDGNWMYTEHPITPWAKAVDACQKVWCCSWLEAAVRLENETLNNRVNNFRKGHEMYFDNGVIETMMVNGDEIVDEVVKDSLEFPIEEQYRIEDVRYMQWGKMDYLALGLPESCKNYGGNHWYAKIGKLDIKDKDGNMKWNTKAEAESAAKWFIENKVSWKRYSGITI